MIKKKRDLSEIQAAQSMAMEISLKERGYKSTDRRKFDRSFRKSIGYDRAKEIASNPPRFTYRLGTIQVLTETRDQPFWTVQKMASGRVLWFTDFPLDVPITSVFAFIEAV